MLPVMKILLLCLLLSVVPIHASELWSTDYQAGLAQAATAKKPVLLEFTGSDWCPPCMKQNKDVFEQPVFQDFAKDHLVLVKLDFPKRKEQAPEIATRNRDLATQYSVNGFPTVVLLSAEGKEITRAVGYGGGSAEEFVAWVEKSLK